MYLTYLKRKQQPDERLQHRKLITVTILLGFLLFNFSGIFHYKIVILTPLFNITFKKKGQKRIFFGLVSTPNYQRQNATYHFWLKQLYIKGIDDAAFITQPSDQEIPSAKYLYPTFEENKMHNKANYADTDRGMKRYIGAKYFLNKSNFDWYWSMTDDVLVDLNALDTMMNDINDHYNTEKDIVIKGHLIKRGRMTFPQGGPGFLMSKAAANLFVKNGVNWVKNLKFPDDGYFEEIIHMLNISFSSIITSYMYGEGSIDQYTKSTSCFNFPSCSSFKYNELFSSKLTPLKKLVAIHFRNHSNKYHVIAMNSFQQLKKCTNLFYYVNSHSINICKKMKNDWVQKLIYRY